VAFLDLRGKFPYKSLVTSAKLEQLATNDYAMYAEGDFVENSIDASKLKDLSITEAKIANDAVTVDKLAHNIDATSIAFNADKVDGLHANQFLACAWGSYRGAADPTDPQPEQAQSIATGLSSIILLAIHGRSKRNGTHYRVNLLYQPNPANEAQQIFLTYDDGSQISSIIFDDDGIAQGSSWGIHHVSGGTFYLSYFSWFNMDVGNNSYFWVAWGKGITS